MKQNQNEFLFYPEAKEGQGRQVIAGVYNSETNTITIAKSECSNKDNFCRDKGRKIALGRARCVRDITPKHYAGLESKAKCVALDMTNSILLPKIFQLESTEKIQNQFLQIAKSL